MEGAVERLLIIGGDQEMCSSIRGCLGREEYEVEVARDGKEGMEMALSRGYKLVMLETVLPGRISSFEVLRQLRTKSAVPIMMISGRSEEIDRIVGLEMGADDYLCQPFSGEELLSRMRAVLRRSESIIMELAMSERKVKYQDGDLELDCGRRLVYCGKNPVPLTAVEFDLLRALLRSAGQVLTRKRLAEEVLDRAISEEDRSIDIHISRLRKKLGPRGRGTERIRSVRRRGYIYVSRALGEGATKPGSNKDPSKGSNNHNMPSSGKAP